MAVEERGGRARDARCRARVRGPLEGEDSLWPSHRAHHGLWSLGGVLCARVGSSSSASLIRYAATSSSGGRGLAGACHSFCGSGCAAGHGSCGAAGWSSAGLSGRMWRLEAGCSSIVRASALPLACCSLPYEWRLCGRIVGDSLRVGSVPVGESVRSAARK